MKKILTVAILVLSLSVNAMAMEVPTGTTVQNLNGSQQYIKTYTVATGVDPQTLIEEPFDFEGYTYTYASIVKAENRSSEKKSHTETVAIETAKNDLSQVLAGLAPTLDYAANSYQGTLALDHTTIQTKAAGYVNKNYTVSEVKEIGNLSSNDMSFVPATTVKNGVTLPLANVEWQVQATALVDDVLVPSQYAAVATYSSRASYQAATGYITTADYVGEISRDQVDSVTYTVTYLGTEIVPEVLPMAKGSVEALLPWVIGGAVLVLVATLAILLWRSRRQLAHLRGSMVEHEVEDAELEEETE
ncbi:MAG: hypothetical protein RR949_08685 [Oscillospiraceae bacterium]